MKIAVIGATGTIGSAGTKALEERGHTVLAVTRTSTPALDIEDPASIRAFYEQAGPLDAIVSATGRAAFGPVHAAPDESFQLALDSKLMGQVNLVRQGATRLGEGGVMVLTAGLLAHAPWPGSSAVAMVNAGIEGFVRGAALDLQGGRRVVAVSPPLVRESAVAMGMDAQGPTAAEVALAYVAAVEGEGNGATLFVDGYAP
jgi:NAD(P)-dependent dehydrogenase (short-subunit alcohol dehydrogenase family)